ncbi:hypothetical protein [Acuticoccus sediminis]|nr:hypothetical protein [Acuticoccus sediminis]
MDALHPDRGCQQVQTSGYASRPAGEGRIEDLLIVGPLGTSRTYDDTIN